MTTPNDQHTIVTLSAVETALTGCGLLSESAIRTIIGRLKTINGAETVSKLIDALLGYLELGDLEESLAEIRVLGHIAPLKARVAQIDSGADLTERQEKILQLLGELEAAFAKTREELSVALETVLKNPAILDGRVQVEDAVEAMTALLQAITGEIAAGITTETLPLVRSHLLSYHTGDELIVGNEEIVTAVRALLDALVKSAK